MICDTCKHKNNEDFFVCDVCIHESSLKDRYERITNADRIRAMSDEELANLLIHGCQDSKCEDQPQNEYGSVNCFDCRMKWLQQPAED